MSRVFIPTVSGLPTLELSLLVAWDVPTKMAGALLLMVAPGDPTAYSLQNGS